MKTTHHELAAALIGQALAEGTLEVVQNGATVTLMARPNGLGIRATLAQFKLLRETANA